MRDDQRKRVRCLTGPQCEDRGAERGLVQLFWQDLFFAPSGHEAFRCIGDEGLEDLLVFAVNLGKYVDDEVGLMQHDNTKVSR